MNTINGDSYSHLFTAGTVIGDMDKWFCIPASCSFIVTISCDPDNAYFTNRTLLVANKQIGCCFQRDEIRAEMSIKTNNQCPNKNVVNGHTH